MKIRFVDGCLIVTTNTKPKKGDWMCCFAHGVMGKDGKYFGRKRYLSYHDDRPVSRLNAICEGVEKVILKLGKSK